VRTIIHHRKESVHMPVSSDVSSLGPPEPGRLTRPVSSDLAGWKRWLPGVQMLARYEPAWLAHDLMAGLVLTTMLVPVGIAYAVASGVPGIYGLYATIVPLLAYALFGPSRILVLGPDSSLAALILAVVLPLSGGDPMRAVALAGMMAVVSGLVCILAGLLRLGFITELLSKPIRYGYMNGIALTVLISQLPKLFGISIDSDGPLRDLWHIGEALLDGAANWTAFAIGAATLALIFLLKPWQRIPGILIAVAGRDARGRPVRSGADGGREGARCAAAGPARVRAAVGRAGRSRRRGDRRLRRGAGVVCRHQRAVAHLRSADAQLRRPEPGDDRAGRGQPGRGLCSRAFRSAAVPRARRWPKPPVQRRSSPAWSARWRSRCCCCWRPTCCATCPPARWPPW
jgi:hypothetical protein